MSSIQNETCSVSGCDRPIDRRGWCTSHYQRWRKHGDPTAGRTTPGEPLEFFREVVLLYDGDECLTWPYATGDHGYAHLWLDQRVQRVSRLVCKEQHGPAPSPEHEAAHSCGNGHLGCVSKQHISWKTPAQNSRDRIVHGTQVRGENSHLSKLSEDEVQNIRAANHLTLSEAAKQFGIAPNQVWRIRKGKSWSWLGEAA